VATVELADAAETSGIFIRKVSVASVEEREHLVTSRYLPKRLQRWKARMVLRFMFLAFAAEANREGRVSALGIGIYGIDVPQVPAVIPSLALVTQIRFELEECALPHRVGVTIRNPDGTPAGASVAQVTPEMPSSLPERGSDSACIFQWVGVVLTQEGIYHIDVKADGNRLGTLDFAVSIPRAPANGG
jgi:hypothetical protein